MDLVVQCVENHCVIGLTFWTKTLALRTLQWASVGTARYIRVCGDSQTKPFSVDVVRVLCTVFLFDLTDTSSSLSELFQVHHSNLARSPVLLFTLTSWKNTQKKKHQPNVLSCYWNTRSSAVFKDNHQRKPINCAEKQQQQQQQQRDDDAGTNK